MLLPPPRKRRNMAEDEFYALPDWRLPGWLARIGRRLRQPASAPDRPETRDDPAAPAESGDQPAENRPAAERGAENRYCGAGLTWAPKAAAACQGQRGS